MRNIIATLALLALAGSAQAAFGPCTDQAGKPLDPVACAFNAAQRGQVIPNGSPAFMKLYPVNGPYAN